MLVWVDGNFRVRARTRKVARSRMLNGRSTRWIENVSFVH